MSEHSLSTYRFSMAQSKAFFDACDIETQAKLQFDCFFCQVRKYLSNWAQGIDWPCRNCVQCPLDV